jgi:hypothetical protein
MTAAADELDAVRRVADAVLYEGYLLYPYRASSSKNKVRWQFGVLGPQGAAAAGTGEEADLYTECLIEGGSDATVDVHVRFLHTQWRGIEAADGEGGFRPVDELVVGGARWIGWHEAVEHEHVVRAVAASGPGMATDVAVPGGEDLELLRDDMGAVVGRLVRTRWPLSLQIEVAATPVPDRSGLQVLRIALTNTADCGADEGAGGTVRDRVARRSLVGTHLVLRASGGRFLSTVDPPDHAVAAARSCSRSRCWPVLAGVHDPEGSQSSDTVLAAPIILYDHPVIADESPGELFDSTEIDEILTLRIMTMTDDEKLAARGTDPRAAAIIDRCDDMPPEVFERMHGALRGYGIEAGPDRRIGGLPDDWDIPTFSTPSLLDVEGPSFDTGGAPWWDPIQDASVSPGTDAVLVAGVRVARGSRVRLHPGRRSDAQDLFLADMTATVRAVLADVDGGTHVGVLLDDDPASELHDEAGRFFYFAPDEIEPLLDEVAP